MKTDGTGFNTCKECHKTESLWNHTTTDHREAEELEDRRNVGESTCNFGDGTVQRVQSLMMMMMMMMMMMNSPLYIYKCVNVEFKCREMVSTLAKNATKPNPFEIVLLQTTRKENSWKTEETLERTVVTLETERFKGSNPWCLWWRWWWWWWIRLFTFKGTKTVRPKLSSTERYWWWSR